MSLHAALRELDYPCAYPYKLICKPSAIETVRARVLETLGDDARILDVHQRASRSGRYVSLTVSFEAKSAEQIEAVYDALTGVDGIVTSL